VKAEFQFVRRLIAGLRNPQVAAAAVILVDRAGRQEYFTIADEGTRWLSVKVDVKSPGRRMESTAAIGASALPNPRDRND
jgi:hypothetical protein